MNIQTINPATEEILSTYSLQTSDDVNALIDSAHTRFQAWRKTDFEERARCMQRLVTCLRQKSDELARLITCEMGKPITAARAEIEKCAQVCAYYAQHAAEFLAPECVLTGAQKNTICYQPLGVLFAIMPWNFPFWQVFRFAAPNIMAANVVILKHAAASIGCGQAIHALFLEAGFPPHVFQHVVIDTDMAATVIAHESVRGVTLTGSERAGRIVAAHAGEHLKKVVLELGGSDPYVVLADADLTLAAEAIVTSRLNNAGQTCIAAKRTIVVKAVAADLIKALMVHMTRWHVGDPQDPMTQMGPMVRADSRQALHQQVLNTIAAGAQALLGGVIPAGRGYYYPPTLLTGVKPGMPAFDDELFGPVIAVIEARDEADAIRLANQSRYGLGAAVFTRDLARGEQIAMYGIEAGSCYVNKYVASDPRLPFGGIKHSGFGRELSRDGIMEFVNRKTVGIHE